MLTVEEENPEQALQKLQKNNNKEKNPALQ